MKKIIHTCFLALLCLVGRYLSTLDKVADPPTEEPNHLSAQPSELRSVRLPFTFLESGFHVSTPSGDTHRGGETLPDFPSLTQDSDHYQRPKYVEAPSPTFQHYTAIDGGPKSVSSVESWPVDHRSKGFSLVDDSTSHGQEERNPSAHMGEGVALIYGEIINPDSLGPIRFKFSPYGGGSVLGTEEIETSTTHGTFFDGILDPRVRKFETRYQFESDFAYLNLTIENRPVLEDFIIFPHDSVKIGIDLQRFQVVFGGPSGLWFEAQYEVKKAIQQHLFDSPRLLIETDMERLLNQNDHREQLAEANGRFGARLEILEVGKDAEQYDLDLLKIPNFSGIPGFETLQRYKSRLDPDRYEILLSDLVGNYYAVGLSKLRRFGLVISQQRGDSATFNRLKSEFPNVLANLKNHFHTRPNLQATAGNVNFVSEWVQAKSKLENRKFSEIVLAEFDGDFKDRLLSNHLALNLSRQKDPLEFIEEFLPHVDSEPWKSSLISFRNQFTLGIPLNPAVLGDLSGKELNWTNFEGSPTLVFFYFSTCTFSAKFFHDFLWPLYQELGQKEGLKLLAVSVDNDQDLWKRSISEYSDSSLTNVNLPSKKWRSWLDYYLINSYPRAFLLDPEGNLLSLRIREHSYDEFKERVLSLLKHPTQTPNETNTITPYKPKYP